MSDETQGQWRFPAVRVGEFVLVARNPQDQNMVLAQVREVGTESIDVIAWGYGGPVPMFNVLHKDDPSLPNRPDIFRLGDSGVFVLSEQAKTVGRLTEMADKMAAYIKEVGELRTDVVNLQSEVYRLKQSTQALCRSRLGKGAGRKAVEEAAGESADEE